MANDTLLTDDAVAELLAKEASDYSLRYSSLGLEGAARSSRPTTKAKPNTRFLRNIIRETKNHNEALLAKEAAEAQARLDGLREAKEREERKHRPDARDLRRRQLGAITATLQGKKRKAGGEEGGRAGKRVAVERKNERGEQESRKSDHSSREDRREKEEPDKDRRSRRNGDQESERQRRRRNSSSPLSSPERRVKSSRRRDRSRSPEYKEREQRHRQRRSHRHRERSRSPSDSETATAKRSSSHRRHRSERHRDHDYERRDQDHKDREARDRDRRDREDRDREGRHRNHKDHETEGRTSSSPRHHQHLHKGRDAGTASEESTQEEKHDDSDPLESLIGPIPPSPPRIRRKGRGLTSSHPSSTINDRFSATYDPKSDIQPTLDSDLDTDDWADALEAVRDREKWRRQGAERLREAGFSEEQIRGWEKGSGGKEKGVEDVRWKGRGEGREWDKGKDMNGEREGGRTGVLGWDV